MNTGYKHTGLLYHDRNKAELFFTEILGLPKVKSYVLSETLTEALFGIKEKTEADLFDNGKISFEVFYGNLPVNTNFNHTCLEVESKNEFVELTKKHGLAPRIVKKEGKDLLFIEDFSGNLYEVKESVKDRETY